jgi:hypothetical protein
VGEGACSVCRIESIQLLDTFCNRCTAAVIDEGTGGIAGPNR